MFLNSHKHSTQFYACFELKHLFTVLSYSYQIISNHCAEWNPPVIDVRSLRWTEIQQFKEEIGNRFFRFVLLSAADDSIPYDCGAENIVA